MNQIPRTCCQRINFELSIVCRHRQSYSITPDIEFVQLSNLSPSSLIHYRSKKQTTLSKQEIVFGVRRGLITVFPDFHDWHRFPFFLKIGDDFDYSAIIFVVCFSLRSRNCQEAFLRFRRTAASEVFWLVFSTLTSLTSSKNHCWISTQGFTKNRSARRYFGQRQCMA